MRCLAVFHVIEFYFNPFFHVNFLSNQIFLIKNPQAFFQLNFPRYSFKNSLQYASLQIIFVLFSQLNDFSRNLHPFTAAPLHHLPLIIICCLNKQQLLH